MVSWLSLLPILLLAPASGALRVPAQSPQTLPESTSLSTLFEYAKRHEIDAVLRLGQDSKHSGDRAWEIGYPVALFIASPEKYRSGFVEHFPVDAEGIMQILYEKIEVPKLTPKWLFSFESLGSIARTGDALAIDRCMKGLASSRGVVAEANCASLEKIFESQKEIFQKALLALTVEQREPFTACFSTWAPTQLDQLQSSLRALQATDGAPPEQRASIDVLLASIRKAEALRDDKGRAGSGIEGVVLIGPTRPSVRVGDDTPDETPTAAKLQVMSVADGSEVARFESGQDGKFRAALPPGDYLIRPAQVPGQRYPMSVEVQVQVKTGEYSFVILHLDSGLR
jgi:hypothetical protein